MATIVWLPVPTALLYTTPGDAGQKLFYVGTLVLNAVAVLLTALHLRRHPELVDEPPRLLHDRVVAETVVLALYLVALVLVLLIPGGSGYLGMFVLLLVSPVLRLVRRRRHAR